MLLAYLLLWIVAVLFHGCVLVLTPVLPTFLFAFRVATLFDQLLLIPVQILILVKRMLAQVTHVNIDLGLISSHVLIDFT